MYPRADASVRVRSDRALRIEEWAASVDSTEWWALGCGGLITLTFPSSFTLTISFPETNSKSNNSTIPPWAGNVTAALFRVMRVSRISRIGGTEQRSDCRPREQYYYSDPLEVHF